MRGEQQLAQGLVFQDDVIDPNDVGFDLKALEVAGREAQVNPKAWVDPGTGKKFNDHDHALHGDFKAEHPPDMVGVD